MRRHVVLLDGGPSWKKKLESIFKCVWWNSAAWLKPDVTEHLLLRFALGQVQKTMVCWACRGFITDWVKPVYAEPACLFPWRHAKARRCLWIPNPEMILLQANLESLYLLFVSSKHFAAQPRRLNQKCNSPSSRATDACSNSSRVPSHAMRVPYLHVHHTMPCRFSPNSASQFGFTWVWFVCVCVCGVFKHTHRHEPTFTRAMT
jgi:hypothetical protein